MKLTNLFSGILLATTITGGFYLWKTIQAKEELLTREISELQDQYDQLINHQEAIERGELLDMRSPFSGWSDVRNGMRDAVVQVIAHVAQFNWTEPYKTPEQGQGLGSGFFISDDGDIITNAHVVDQAQSVFIKIPSQGKRQFHAEVVCVSMERDIALIRLDESSLQLLRSLIGTIPTIPLGDSDRVRGSDELMTLGYPLGQHSLKGTTGIVSGREHIDGHYLIQISAPINPGNSGGPSINRFGEVIGVNTSTMKGTQNVNYIIPSNEVILFLKQLDHAEATDTQGTKLLRNGYLGVFNDAASEELTAHLGNPPPGGLFIVDVCPNGLGQKVGLQPHDMLYSINGHSIDIFGEMAVPWSEDKVSLQDFISRLCFGDQITIAGYRSGTPFEYTFTFEPSTPFAVRYVYPGYEPIDYEVFAGMVLMNASLNLVYTLLPSSPGLIRYADPREQLKPSVMVTHVMPDSVVTRIRLSCRPGTVLDEVNGIKVTTLDEFRAASAISLTTNRFTVKTRDGLLLAYSLPTILSDEEKLSRTYFYPITANTRTLIQEFKARNNITDTANTITPRILNPGKALAAVVHAADQRIISHGSLRKQSNHGTPQKTA